MNVKTSDIKSGLGTVAKLIEAYGEKYWPIFACLEKELEKRQLRNKRVQIYLSGRREGHLKASTRKQKIKARELAEHGL